MTTAPHQRTLNSVSAPENEELQALDDYWRTANHLADDMLDLQEYLLLKEPLRPEHI